MTKKENLFQEHYYHTSPFIGQEDSDSETATEHTNITIAYHKRCLELILEEWTKGKFQEPLNAIIRREIEELNN